MGKAVYGFVDNDKIPSVRNADNSAVADASRKHLERSALTRSQPGDVRRNMQKGDFKLGPHMTEMQGERIIELLEDLVSLCQENLDQIIAQELKHHYASYPITTSYPFTISYPGEDSDVSYSGGH